MANESSSVSKGFGAACGVILAIITASGLVMFLLCGGCGLFIGGSSVAMKEAQHAAQVAQERQAAAIQAGDAAEQSQQADAADSATLPLANSEVDPLAQPTANGDAPSESRPAAPESKETPATSLDAEGKAEARFKVVEALLKTGSRSSAKRILQEIVKEYPGTSAAEKSASKLKELE